MLQRRRSFAATVQLGVFQNVKLKGRYDHLAAVLRRCSFTVLVYPKM
jgi:hypothetical protein